MARGNAYRFARFGRGLNTADGPYGLREGYADDPQGLGAECRDCLNVVSRDRGNVSKRDGSTLEFAEAGIKDLSAVGQDATSHLIYSTTAGALKARTAAGATNTLIASGLSTSARWQFLRLPIIGLEGPYYGMNGVDTPQETDGVSTTDWARSGTVAGAATINGRFLAYRGNRLFVAGDPARPYSVLISQPGNPTVFNIEVQFAPGSTYPITGLGTVGPYVIVFTERQIHVIYDTETGANRTLADGAGTLSPYSVVETPSGLMFLDPTQGVMATDGSAVRRVSEQIQPTLDGIGDVALADVTGAYFGDHYYLATTLFGARVLLDFDTGLNSWWRHDPPVGPLAVWDSGSGSRLVGATPTQVWRLFAPGASTDPSGIFVSYWSGPFHTFGAPHLRKRGREVHFDGRGRFDVYLQGDYEPGAGTLEDQFSLSEAGGVFAGGGTFAGAGTFAGSVTIGEDSIYSFGVSRSWSVTTYSATADYWELDAYTMLMTTRTE